MNLKEIYFKPKDGEATPNSIAVNMSIEEALWIVTVAGQQKGESPHTDMFSCLTNDVFNRYWEDGATDAKKEIHVETPPIIYDES